MSHVHVLLFLKSSFVSLYKPRFGTNTEFQPNTQLNPECSRLHPKERSYQDIPKKLRVPN
jgi:hypothetical protein